MIWNSSLWDGKGCQKMESCSKLPYVQMQAEKMTANNTDQICPKIC